MASCGIASPEFAFLLRRWRERAGVSVNEAARGAGVDPSYVSRLERLEREPPRRHIVIGLADAINLSKDETDELLLVCGYAPDDWRTRLDRMRAVEEWMVDTRERFGALGEMVG